MKAEWLGMEAGKCSDVYSLKVKKNEDEHVLHSSCMMGVIKTYTIMQTAYKSS